MKIIIPMAGRGSRFSGSAYDKPKPLIEVNGIPMFIHALRSLEGVDYNQLIFIGLNEHNDKYGLTDIINQYVIMPHETVLIPEITQGQLCTVLKAKKFIDNEEDILIISSDTIVNSSIGNDIINKPKGCKGLISVAPMEGDRWSFAKTDASGRVTEVAEKIRISDNASTGLYYFSNGNEFVNKAENLVKSKKTTNGEYYVIPLYQQYINEGGSIGVSKANEVWDMGTPEALSAYLNSR